MGSMRVLGKPVLADFSRAHPPARTWVSSWLAEAEDAKWQTSHEVRAMYQTVSFLPDNLLVFNVKGNQYRLICKVSYQHSVVRVLWAGTHAEYSKRY